MDDITGFLQNILVLQLYNTDENVFNYDVEEGDANAERNHFINFFNYYTGMRFTLNRYKSEVNSEKSSNNVKCSSVN
jgi:hypothetical protein